MASLKN